MGATFYRYQRAAIGVEVLSKLATSSKIYLWKILVVFGVISELATSAKIYLWLFWVVLGVMSELETLSTIFFIVN